MDLTKSQHKSGEVTRDSCEYSGGGSGKDFRLANSDLRNLQYSKVWLHSPRRFSNFKKLINCFLFTVSCDCSYPKLI